MNKISKCFIVAIALVQVTHGVYTLGSGNSQNLAGLFFRSRMASKDPAVTMACFADYITKSNDVSAAYSASYNQCLLDAKSGRIAIENEMADERKHINLTSIGVCQRLETCNRLNSTLDFFNCHADIGANNTKAVYSISGNASEYANTMQEKYRIIDLKHEQCGKSAERKYVEKTAVIYRALHDCLDGRVPPTTAVPITTTAATPTTTTPTTTPVPSTTTSTAAPVPSTTTPVIVPTAAPIESSTNADNVDVSKSFDAKQLAAQILDIFR